MPFSNNVVLYGQAFPIEKQTTDAEAQDRIARVLDGATEEADRLTGTTPPEVWTRHLRPSPRPFPQRGEGEDST